MLTTSIGIVFQDALKALDDAAPEKLEEIARKSGAGFVESVACVQKALGMLVAYTTRDMEGQLSDVGWLMVALAELSLTWHYLTPPSPQPNGEHGDVPIPSN